MLGVGSVRNAASVGKVGGLALGYFLTMSTFALAIGLVVGNLIEPGKGLNLDESTAGAGAEQAKGAGSTTDFIIGIVPGLDVLRADLRRGAADPARGAARRASRCRPWAARASRSWWASATCSAWSSACSRW